MEDHADTEAGYQHATVALRVDLPVSPALHPGVTHHYVCCLALPQV